MHARTKISAAVALLSGAMFVGSALAQTYYAPSTPAPSTPTTTPSTPSSPEPMTSPGSQVSETTQAPGLPDTGGGWGAMQ